MSVGAEGGIRTHTSLSGQQILSLYCLPFQHLGKSRFAAKVCSKLKLTQRFALQREAGGLFVSAAAEKASEL